MAVDISNTPSIRLNPVQELKLTKPDTELYVGQLLKTVVVKTLSENQVLININGQNINAKTAHHFSPGEVLQVKVMMTEGETILQVLRNPPALTPLQTALLHTLPKQAPATHFLASLSVLDNMPNLPPIIKEQIQQLLANITPLSQLPQQLAQSISHSGSFWEAALLQWHRKGAGELNRDFKGQCLRLLALLMSAGSSSKPSINSEAPSFQSDTLPLPGAVPQPLQRLPPPSFTEQSLDNILAVLREQTEQVLARIKTSQLMHLLNPADQTYSLMLDLPLRTDTGLEVLPLLIKEHRQQQSAESSWSISFAVNFTNLGNIQAKLRLKETMIDIQMNAEKSETIDLLTATQQTIDELLQELGLTLGLWTLHLGLEDNDIDTSNFRLLDIKI